ncbi:HNH endonuclease [Propionibacterium australiense]|uniref:HNH endonuclease n=2 Tax=Propionibacterium australiense TaxID=119981 RepID=A0A8B3FUU3_9ACTN|nr:HNH endonuclease [Propionibacterium australiense]RLP13002.1 HNH endonuclease [Propionibacterium australiense]
MAGPPRFLAQQGSARPEYRLQTGSSHYAQSMAINWTMDELILVCDELQRNRWESIRLADERVTELSELLRRSPFHPLEQPDDSFRSRASVHLKLENLRTCHPSYQGAPTHASRLDSEVVEKFIIDSAGMATHAQMIRNAIVNETVRPDEISAIQTHDPEMTVREGSIVAVLQQRRERDPRIRNHKIKQTREQRGSISCEVCGFDFEEFYGDLGSGYVEVHHRQPLHVSGTTTTRLTDLALVCSNCHRMIHRGYPLLPEELANRVQQAKERNHSGAKMPC